MKLINFKSEPELISVNFKNGLNIICGNKTKNSSEKDSRNGIGKTTLIKLIDFCLTLSLEEKFLENDNFKGYSFELLLEDIKKQKILLKRKISIPNKIIIKIGDSNEIIYDIDDARLILRELFFNIEKTEPQTLSFRTLIKFFLRDEIVGYSGPFKADSRTKEYLKNSINLYLTGLDKYLLPITKENLLKEREGVIKTIFGLERNLKDKNIPTISILKTHKTLLTKALTERKKKLDSFKVLREYEDIERKASKISKRMTEINNQSFFNKEKINEYQTALNEKINIDFEEIEEFYSSLKINFSDKLKKDYSEIVTFHQNVVKNRNTFLKEEIERLNQKNLQLVSALEFFDNKKSTYMKTLESHGALKDYNNLNEGYLEDKEKLFNIEKYIQTYNEIKEYKETKNEIVEDINQNNKDSLELIEKNEKNIDNLILLFDDCFKKILNIQGELVIGYDSDKKTDANQFLFDTNVERGDSAAMKRIQIFAYDISLLIHNINFLNRQYPTFLFHDGILNSVEERQKKNMLKFIIEASKKTNFQYIITMNSDEFVDDIDYKENIILELTDEDIKGNLMKFKF